jgi:hypothetical protein
VTTAEEEAQMAEAADLLARRVVGALPHWVDRCIRRFLPDIDPAVVAPHAQAAVDDVGERVRALLAQDVEEQATSPLALLRTAVKYPAEVLAAAGVAPVGRSDFDRRAFPDDPYGLTPAAWADIDPILHEPGIIWGAAKAFTILNRRR